MPFVQYLFVAKSDNKMKLHFERLLWFVDQQNFYCAFLQEHAHAHTHTQSTPQITRHDTAIRHLKTSKLISIWLCQCYNVIKPANGLPK